MDLKKHIIDTIKEWQLKIGYREGNMKLYYPGESLAVLLGLEAVRNSAGNIVAGVSTPENAKAETQSAENELTYALAAFCDEVEPQLGRIKITGSYARYCLDIPAKGSAYVAGKIPEPEFLKLFLETLTGSGSTMEQIRECFAAYAAEHGTSYREEVIAENGEASDSSGTSGEQHAHLGHAFYFADKAVEEYVYWVEENEFGLTYHRFTHADYEKLK